MSEEPQRTFALVNGGVAVWVWDPDGTLRPPLVLQPGTITEEDMVWARAELVRRGWIEEDTT